MTTRFWKYHGLGNDFLLVDRRGAPDVPPALTRAVCARHTGVGADGIIALITDPAGGVHPFMRVFNADGSTADMCGNGLRCFVRWLVEHIGHAPGPMVVMTDAGEQRCEPLFGDGEVRAVRVDLGAPRFTGPARLESAGADFEGHDLFLGNPHFVIPGAPRDPDEPGRAGPGLSTHRHFLRGTNVEWLDVLSATEARVTVYERGVGLTQACGTGGGGAAATGVRLGLLSADTDLTVHQPGGELTYRVCNDFSSVWMTGPAEPVYEGIWPGSW